MTHNKERIVIVVLVIILLIAAVYIGIRKYEDSQQSTFKQGAQSGYEQAIVTIMQQAATCKPVPVHAGNVSMNLFATECLPKQDAQPTK